MAEKGKQTPLILIATLLTVAAIAALFFFSPNSGVRGVKDYIAFFKEVVGLIKTEYVEKVDDKKLIESAVNGMLAALDPHNAYMPPDSFREMQVEMAGEFGGVGIEITIKDGKLTVISPIADTPAFRAGIRPGDNIWVIDNAFTRSMTINEAVKRMRGTPGTRVTLVILREGAAKPLLFKLKREVIRIRSVRYRTLEKGYGYIRIAQFQERSAEEFAAALRALHRENSSGLRGLVLDLRNNPGGLVDPAVDVAGRFLGEQLQGGLIVSMKGRDPASRGELSATIGEKEPHYPLVVLINGGSASAAEIVAGALQDYGRAVIMGTQSFGKGSVQSIIPLAGGAGLKLTTARYYTPKGRSIQARGITPDVIVEREEQATKVRKEPFDIREEDLDGHIPPADAVRPTKRAGERSPAVTKTDEELTKDYQLSRALDLLRGVDLLRKMNQAAGNGTAP